jgi:predicted kinase
VLVAGAPGSGKTTLARRLAVALGMPVLHRDPISHAIADAFEAREPAMRALVMQASFGVFYAIMDDLLAVSGAVAETNFHHGVSEPEVGLRAAAARTVLIHCETPYEVSVARFRRRWEHGERHWSTYDAARLAQIDAGEVPAAWANAVPMELPVPIMRVDTTDGYTPPFNAIIAFIRASTEDSPP